MWFPTPETRDPSEKLTPVQRKIYNQLQESREAEQRKPLENENGKIWFLQQFQWENSVLNEEQRNEVEKLLLEFNDIFARHRFDVGYNTEYKVKLNPDENKRVYTQSHPSAIHLREELLVELALFQYYNISNSRYSSPIFAQRKSNGRLRLLIDLRRVNHLLRQEYRDSNFPISNMSDATNHCAGKSLLNKFDCSQAYHCVQMADDQSIQLLAFNYSSRTYAYKCLAQRLAKSVRGFSAFIRNYLDPCPAAGSCTQFMDEIGCGVEKFEELVPKLRKIFSCIRKPGLKFATAKCHIGNEKIEFLGNMITTEGFQPESAKGHKFLKTMKMPRTVKQVKRLIGLYHFFRNFLPNLNETLLPFYKLLKFNAEFFINDEHVKALEKLQEKLLIANNSGPLQPQARASYNASSEPLRGFDAYGNRIC